MVSLRAPNRMGMKNGDMRNPKQWEGRKGGEEIEGELHK
jgi:hypothetical protein